MKYNKLVRDKIPEIIEKKGDKPVTHIADEHEYWRKLKEKLFEELREFEAEDNVEELADLLEVIDAICEYKKFDRKELDAKKEKKAKERGRFTKRIILDETIGS